MVNAGQRAMRRRYVREFYRGNGIRYAVVLISAILQALMMLVVSALLQQIIDLMTGTGAGYNFRQLLMFTIAMLVSLALLSAASICASPGFYARAMSQYRNYAFGRIVEKSISAFIREDTSKYVSALTNDATSIEQDYLEGQFSLVCQALMFVGAFAMMIWYSPLLSLAAVGLSLLPVVALLLAGDRQAKAEKRVSDCNSSFVATVQDMLSGFSVIKSFKAESAVCDQFAHSNGEVATARRDRQRVALTISSAGEMAGITAQFGVFLIGAYLALSGYGVTPGIVAAFINLMNLVIQPIGQAPALLARRRAAIALIDKLADASADNVRAVSSKATGECTGRIEFRNVSFGYEQDSEVIHNISACFEAGKCYAVVGASGSGKSTLLSLLMGGYSDYTGEIMYDDMELRTMDSELLYGIASLIQQNVFVFNTSIMNNITLFRDFDESQIKRAISQSGLDDLIAQRGADYLCGENGSALSGGERQRISIARCLLRHNRVLLVDEATAALDASTAYRVVNSILSLEWLTRIVVTHALDAALLKRYDGIIALKNGSIVEQGSFDELMERKGYFYSLYTVSQ